MTRDQFLAQITPLAQAAGQRTGVDWRIIVAQAAQETGWGAHAPGNNFFGIKSHGRAGGQNLATKEHVGGRQVGENASFRSYGSMADSVNDYADFLTTNSRYRPMLAAQGLEAQAAALGASGYATDPNYGNSVLQIARSLGNGGTPVPPQTIPPTSAARQDRSPMAPLMSAPDRRLNRTQGGTPILDRIAAFVQARRAGETPIRDRMAGNREARQAGGTPVLDAMRNRMRERRGFDPLSTTPKPNPAPTIPVTGNTLPPLNEAMPATGMPRMDAAPIPTTQAQFPPRQPSPPLPSMEMPQLGAPPSAPQPQMPPGGLMRPGASGGALPAQFSTPASSAGVLPANGLNIGKPPEHTLLDARARGMNPMQNPQAWQAFMEELRQRGAIPWRR